MNNSKQTFLHKQGNANGGIFDRILGTSSVEPSVVNTLAGSEQLQAESFARMIEIIKKRSHTDSNPLVTTVIGKEDFVPISFLETGLKKSISVCRISRYFDLETFQAFVKMLAADIKRYGKASHNFDSVEKITEVFSIPPQIAAAIFNKSIRQAIQENQITPLEVLQNISETQLSKILPIPIGTGFLVGGNHMLTNQHVLPDAETAEQCVAQFSFVDSASGETTNTTDYELDSTFFISEPALDYTLVQLKSSMLTRQAGFEFGWIQLVEDEENVVPRLKWIELEQPTDKITRLLEEFESHIDILINKGYTVIQDDALMIWHPDSSLKEDYYDIEIQVIDWLMEHTFQKKSESGDAAIIVQHPKGRRKQIVLNNNEIIGLYKNYLRYEADTDYGSSGSPVFNNRWELVGLHHAAVVAESQPSGDNRSEQTQAASANIQCQQAVKICSIIKDLKQKSVENHKLRGFIDDFVMTQEHAKFPPLPAALTFDGTNDYIELTKPNQTSKDSRSQDFPEFTIEAWVNPYQSDANTTIFSQSCTEHWYDRFGDDSVLGEYLLSLQLTPEGTVMFSRKPLWKVSSTDFPTHGLLYPFLPAKPGSRDRASRRVHPLELLTLERPTGDRSESDKIPASDSSHKNQAAQLVPHSDSETIKALQIVLYCLGFFSETHYPCDELNNHMHSYYLNVLTGELDSETKQAIANFNDWVKPTIEPNATIDVKDDTGKTTIPAITIPAIAIPAEAIDLFNRRGLSLGVGTTQNRQHTSSIGENQRKRRKNHYGPRVCELQYCLKSLDWENNPLFEEISPSARARHNCFERRHFARIPAVSVTGHFSWWEALPQKADHHDSENQPENRLAEEEQRGQDTYSIEKTTSYAVKKLQRAFYQHSDGILGSLSLAALEKAKSYQVRTKESLPVGQFSHIAVTFNGQEVKIYVNGQLSNRRYTGKHSTGGHISQALLGARPNNSPLNNPRAVRKAHFEEAISELRIWGKSLPQNAIIDRLHRRLNNEEIQDTALVGYWRLEEGRIEDETNKYTLNVKAKGSHQPQQGEDNSQIKPDSISVATEPEQDKKYLVQLDWIDQPKVGKAGAYTTDKRCCVRIFDGSGKLVVDIATSQALLEKSLQQQLVLVKDESQLGTRSIDNTLTQKQRTLLEEILEEISLKLGYRTNAYYVYNAAAKGLPSDTYAARSKFQSQDVRNPVRLQSACSFPATPLPFGLTISKETQLVYNKETSSNASGDSFTIEYAEHNEWTNRLSKKRPVETGITVELWVKHEYGNGTILSGNSETSGTYALIWNNDKIQLTLHHNHSPLVKIETKEPIVNRQIWHHIAFSWGAESQEINLYVDGKRRQAIALQAQETQTLSYKSTYQSIIKFPVETFIADPHTVKILPDVQPDTHFFCCSLTELRIWEVARPQSRIKTRLAQRLDKVKEAENGLIAYWRFDSQAELKAHTSTQSLSQVAHREASPPSSQLAASLTTVIADSKTPLFIDVSPKHWAFEFIAGLQNVGLAGSFVEIGEDKFTPDAFINRQELAILLLNTFGGKPKANRANILLQFKDKDDIDSRYLADIEYVWRLGLMSGDVIAENATSASRRIIEITFNPTVEVSRGVAISSIFDSLRGYWEKDYADDITGNTRNDELEQVLDEYEDIPKDLDHFLGWIPRKRIAIALQKKLIVHRNKNTSTLDLDEPATRAEVAAMLYQAICLQPENIDTQLKMKPIKSDHVM